MGLDIKDSRGGLSSGVSRRVVRAYMRVIPLLARATGLCAITFDFSFSAGITRPCFPFLALETEYSVDFVMAWRGVHLGPRGPSHR